MPVQQEDDLKAALRRAYTEEIIAIRQRRRTVEQAWLLSRRQWMGRHLARVIPEGKHVQDLYDIPGARRTEERFITRATKILMPSVKWHEVSPMGDVPQMRLSNVDQWMTYILRKRIPCRAIGAQLVRCFVLYGLGVLKTSIVVENGNVWPAWRAIDPFSFYVFPETAATLEQCDKIFEDYLMSYERYQTYVKQGIIDDVSRADLTKPDWPYHLVERLAYQGITDPTADVDRNIEVRRRNVREQLDQTTAGYASMSELWVRREDALYQVYILWNHVDGPRIVGFFKSIYDSPLFRMSIHRQLPGETYTNTQAQDIDELDNVQNDLFNMFMSSVDWEQGFAAVQANQRHDTWKAKGRAIWQFQDDPKLMLQFIQPPITSVNQLRAFQIATSLMQSMGGAGTIAEGQPGRNMPRAGFAMQSLLNLGMADVQDVAEMVEQLILTPALGDIFRTSHFIPEQQLMRIPGGMAVYDAGVNLDDGSMRALQSNILRKQDIAGDFEFEWIGAQQFQDESQRAGRIMTFMQLLPQIRPMMQEQGFDVNIAELVQYAWRHALGEKGLSKIIIPAQQPQMPGAPMIPGQLPPGQNGRAIPGQAPGMGAPGGPVPGQTARATNGTRPSGVSGLAPPAPTSLGR